MTAHEWLCPPVSVVRPAHAASAHTPSAAACSEVAVLDPVKLLGPVPVALDEAVPVELLEPVVVVVGAGELVDVTGGMTSTIGSVLTRLLDLSAT